MSGSRRRIFSVVSSVRVPAIFMITRGLLIAILCVRAVGGSAASLGSLWTAGSQLELAVGMELQ
jgi:hypothetical protein